MKAKCPKKALPVRTSIGLGAEPEGKVSTEMQRKHQFSGKEKHQPSFPRSSCVATNTGKSVDEAPWWEGVGMDGGVKTTETVVWGDWPLSMSCVCAQLLRVRSDSL